MKRFIVIVMSMFALLLPLALHAATTSNSMHPAFPVLDKNGLPVSESGEAPSSVKTCGSCHDAEYINRHNSHFNGKVQAGCIECHFENSLIPTDETAFDEGGLLRRELIRISTPRNANCAHCHGIVHNDLSPVSIPEDYEYDTSRYDLTRNTGAMVSPQNISDSLLNLKNKETLAYPWDVHSARMVGCTACHFAGNNPSKIDRKLGDLDFLVNDPRRISTSEYLRRPNHKLAAAACADCHDPLATHAFLPYRERHFEVLSCESCHISSIKGPAIKSRDFTSVTLQGTPLIEYRGIESEQLDSLNAAFGAGYTPFLFAGSATAGPGKIAPFNLVTEWRWVSGDGGAAVPFETVSKAYLEAGQYRSAVIKAFDADGNSELSPLELRLDSPVKTSLIEAALKDLGVKDPRIKSETAAHEIHHGVMPGHWVKKDCSRCHARESDLNRDVPLSVFAPANIKPELPNGGALSAAGEVNSDGGGSVILKKNPDSSPYYVFGHTRASWSDLLGMLFMAAVVFGVAVHGGYRIYTRRNRQAIHGQAERVYLYSAYERIWHWVMALSVLLLLLTGLQIHFSGSGRSNTLFLSVSVHNFFAVVLVVNAFLSLFYHLSSNAIKQFIPSRRNLKGEVAAQTLYYLNGIFAGHPHPMPESPERKLNVLQQITYLLLLNVLLPMQVVTGVMIWGVSRWPDLAAQLGGLFIIAPLHNLGSWLFLSFFVLHFYLTTTGRTTFSNIRAMIDGYKDIEAPASSTQGGRNG